MDDLGEALGFAIVFIGSILGIISTIGAIMAAIVWLIS